MAAYVTPVHVGKTQNTQYLRKIDKFTFRRDALKALKLVKSIIFSTVDKRVFSI